MLLEQDFRALFLEKINLKPKMTTIVGLNTTTIRYYRGAFKKGKITVDTMLDILAKFDLAYQPKILFGKSIFEIDELFIKTAQNDALINLYLMHAYCLDFKIKYIKNIHPTISVCFIEQKINKS